MKKLILVTGIHRSGSTWTGRMISIAPGVHYVFEPFNNHTSLRDTSRTPLSNVFEYIDGSDKKNKKFSIFSSNPLSLEI